MISLETLALARKYTRKYVDEHGGGIEYVQYNTTAGWNEQLTLIAEQGVIYVYSDHSYIDNPGGDPIPSPGLKVGDGTSYLIDLPFATEAEIQSIGVQLTQHVADDVAHITSAERTDWNSKVSVRINPSDAENLVLFC